MLKLVNKITELIFQVVLVNLCIHYDRLWMITNQPITQKLPCRLVLRFQNKLIKRNTILTDIYFSISISIKCRSRSRSIR